MFIFIYFLFIYLFFFCLDFDFYEVFLKMLSGMANSVDPDHMAPLGAM